MGVGSERSHARKSKRLGKLGFSKISRVLERILMEHIDTKISSESKLRIGYKILAKLSLELETYSKNRL